MDQPADEWADKLTHRQTDQPRIILTKRTSVPSEAIAAILINTLLTMYKTVMWKRKRKLEAEAPEGAIFYGSGSGSSKKNIGSGSGSGSDINH